MASLLPRLPAGETQIDAWASSRRDAARGSAPPLALPDILIAAAWFVAAWLVYVHFGLRLAQGVYFEYYNLAFDFDPPLTLRTLALSPADPQGVKHPLMLLVRPLAWPFLAAGWSPKEAAALVMVTFGAGTVAICSMFLRAAHVGRPEAASLCLLFAVTGTQLFTSIIVETYAISGFAIALIWLAAVIRLDDPSRLRRLRYLAALLAFGVTITNFAQAMIAEMLVCWRHGGLRHAIKGVVVFGLGCAAIAAILVVAVWHAELWSAARNPVLAIKEVYWLQPTEERTGIGQILLTFFGFSFVSPQYSWVLLEDGLPIMRDFRSYAFSPAGQAAMPLWLGFWTVGAIAAACHRRYRWIALGLFGATIYNVLLHMDFQNRGSLYIYSAHAHFPIFALGAGLAPSVGRSAGRRAAYLAVVLLLATLIGADNLGMVRGFTTDFDSITIPATENR